VSGVLSGANFDMRIAYEVARVESIVTYLSPVCSLPNHVTKSRRVVITYIMTTRDVRIYIIIGINIEDV
jgi:hypothetical protein